MVETRRSPSLSAHPVSVTYMGTHSSLRDLRPCRRQTACLKTSQQAKEQG